MGACHEGHLFFSLLVGVAPCHHLTGSILFLPSLLDTCALMWRSRDGFYPWGSVGLGGLGDTAYRMGGSCDGFSSLWGIRVCHAGAGRIRINGGDSLHLVLAGAPLRYCRHPSGLRICSSILDRPQRSWPG